jgi:hypothetical protein
LAISLFLYQDDQGMTFLWIGQAVPDTEPIDATGAFVPLRSVELSMLGFQWKFHPWFGGTAEGFEDPQEVRDFASTTLRCGGA